MILALLVTAIGGSLIKPCIVGTVARTTDRADQVARLLHLLHAREPRAASSGPILALQMRESLGIAYVLVMAAVVSRD